MPFPKLHLQTLRHTKISSCARYVGKITKVPPAAGWFKTNFTTAEKEICKCCLLRQQISPGEVKETPTSN